MISAAYPLPSIIPQEVQDKIHMYILGTQGTPSSRLIDQVLVDYHKRFPAKKRREWNVYAYWGIQCFGRQCEMDSRNSHIYPLHIWCDVRLMMTSYNSDAIKMKVTLQECYKLEKLKSDLFKKRYKALFA
jgi:hypothetical protein